MDKYRIKLIDEENAGIYEGEQTYLDYLNNASKYYENEAEMASNKRELYRILKQYDKFLDEEYRSLKVKHLSFKCLEYRINTLYYLLEAIREGDFTGMRVEELKKVVLGTHPDYEYGNIFHLHDKW